jgi:hypothetical protein
MIIANSLTALIYVIASGEDQIEPAECPSLDDANIGGRVYRQYWVRGRSLSVEEIGFLRIRRYNHFGLGNQF